MFKEHLNQGILCGKIWEKIHGINIKINYGQI